MPQQFHWAGGLAELGSPSTKYPNIEVKLTFGQLVTRHASVIVVPPHIGYLGAPHKPRENPKASRLRVEEEYRQTMLRQLESTKLYQDKSRRVIFFRGRLTREGI